MHVREVYLIKNSDYQRSLLLGKALKSLRSSKIGVYYFVKDIISARRDMVRQT